MASECAEAHRNGYTAFKTKGRPWFDVFAQVREAAKVVPESFRIDMDFNDTLLDAERGIPILTELAKYPADRHLRDRRSPRATSRATARSAPPPASRSPCTTATPGRSTP